MKFALILFVLVGFVQNTFSQDELFEGVDQKTMYIYPSIPIVEGADLLEFHEAYSRSRSEQFGELVDSAERLITAGATGAEALEMVMVFDQMITYRRAYAKKRMGVSIEGYFNSRLSELYRKFTPPTQRLDFKHVDIPTNILRHANKNKRPGFIKDEDLEKIDFIVYGSYTNSFVPGRIDVAMYVVNVHSGVTRVFNGHGTPKVAAYQAAGQLFHEFQKTKFPSTLELENGKRIKLLDADRVTSAALTSVKNLYQEALWSCEDLGGRLANKRELNSINRAGSYRGGVTVHSRGKENFFWALDNNDVYKSYANSTSKKWGVNSSKALNYVCVE